MVWLIVFGIFLLIAGIVTLFLPKKVEDNGTDLHPRRWGKITTGILAGIFVLVWVLSSVATVGTKDVGIVTSFGKTTGHLSNGIHLVWPWQNVTPMDAAVQTDSFTNGNCVSVRIANQQTACVDVSIRWRIEPSYADSLFQNYRTFDQVRDSLVTRELRSALNAQLTEYNPINSIDIGTAASGVGNPTLTQISTAVTKQMQSEIGGQGIDVINTIIPIMTFDPSTQNRLNQLQQQQALTRVAEAQEQTNAAQSAANNALSQSVANTNVLIAQCLTNQEQIIKQGGIPVTSCFPGSGGSTNVVIPSGAK